MPIAALGQALNRLGLPKKLTYLLLITYRYLFVIEQEYQRLRRALKIRGFKSGTNLHSYKTFAYLVGMLLVKASARARRVHHAMLCRGFKGRFYSLHQPQPSTSNWLFALVMGLVVAGLIGIELL